ISALMFFAIWLLLTRTRIGLVIQAALTHREMVGALGHNVPRVFTIVFVGGSALAGLAGVIGGNYLVTEPAMAFAMGPIVFVVVVFGALVVPWLFFDWTTGRHSGFVVAMLSQMGMMIIFALSYNMQMGQAGLLSFGHAVFFGLGGYCTAHALNTIKARGLWLPVEAVPLIGGLGGLGFAIALGYVATKQRATAFAMITLGIDELIT